MPSPRSLPPTLHTFTANDLRDMEIPPQQWVVPDVIAYGLWLLAAPPKTGKSWWVLALLLSVAAGGLAFGKIPVEPAGVLYLALEDTRQRLRTRLQFLGADETGWPTTFHMLTEAPGLDRGLIQALRKWIQDHPSTKVIAIDTLVRIRGQRIKSEDLYSGDSRMVSELQALTKEFDICILLVHHTRKSQGADPFEEISGSYGITGPLDGMIVIKRTRGDADATMHITGRDVEDRELALQFDNHTGLWQVLGSAREWSLSQERRAILRALEEAPEGLTPKEIAEAATLKRDSTRHLLIRMRNEGMLASDDKGNYSIVHLVHSVLEDATETAQTPVNGTDPSHSQAFTPNPPVNAVNGDTPEEVKNLHKKWIAGEFQGTDAQDELTAIFSKDRATTEDRARLRSLIQEHSA